MIHLPREVNMGASGWNYFTPYRDDVGQALQELRERVFREKAYGDPALSDMPFPPAALAALPPEQRAAFEAMLAERNKLLEPLRALEAQRPEPRTIEELLEQQAESGTHSILDITEGLSDGPDFGTAFPMPQDMLRELFGTLQPTHEQVEAKAMERSEDLDRWQCWYVVVYRDGAPSEMYFEGCSGD
jgi:hypothetical protein